PRSALLPCTPPFRPLQALHPVEVTEQAGEARAVRLVARPQVATVGVDVLAEQGDLPHAVGDQAPDLGHELTGRAAELGAAHVRRSEAHTSELQSREN